MKMKILLQHLQQIAHVTRAPHHAQPALHARLAPHRRDLRSCIRPSPPWPLCSYDAPFNRRPSIPATRLPCTDTLIQVRLQFSCACARVLVVRGAFRRCSCAFPLCRPRFISCCCVVRCRLVPSWRVCAVVLCCRVFLLPSCGAVVLFHAVRLLRQLHALGNPNTQQRQSIGQHIAGLLG